MRRSDLLAGIGAAAALSAGAAPAGAQTPTAAPELTALLARLRPEGGMIPAERVRAAGMPVDRLMNALIPWAKTFADPPISHFYVGAIVEGASGALYAGMNLEFPGQTLASTVHGEGAATTNAWLHGETGIVSLAVGGVPCGYCRQFLSEFVEPKRLRIWMPDGTSLTLDDAMPHAFLPSVLGITTDPFHAHTPLIDRPSVSLENDRIDIARSVLRSAAYAAAERSHAPYSGTRAGVALALRDGIVLAGRHAENVAFNPGMPALQSACIALRLRGYAYSDITAAMLVETAGHASQHAVTQNVLAAIAPVQLAYEVAALRS